MNPRSDEKWGQKKPGAAENYLLCTLYSTDRKLYRMAGPLTISLPCWFAGIRSYPEV